MYMFYIIYPSFDYSSSVCLSSEDVILSGELYVNVPVSRVFKIDPSFYCHLDFTRWVLPCSFPLTSRLKVHKFELRLSMSKACSSNVVSSLCL